MARKRKPTTVVTLTVCSDRTVAGHTHGQTFTVDLGPEGDARDAQVRQIWGWWKGRHVTIDAGGDLIDPVFATNTANSGEAS